MPKRINYVIFDILCDSQSKIQGKNGSQFYVVVELRDIVFENHEMTGHWYNGVHPLYKIMLHMNKFYTIYADAFAGSAFRQLQVLEMCMVYSSIRIHAGAFDGLVALKKISLTAKFIELLPDGLFGAMAATINYINFWSWPKSINLNAVFANGTFSMLKTLDIRYVDEPQKNFRLLAASNFTAIPYLNELKFLDCGIEVITDQTFDVVGRTLLKISLAENRIKFLDVRMFRTFFETKSVPELKIIDNQIDMGCSCRLAAFDVMICPFQTISDLMCTECKPQNFDVVACGIYNTIDTRKLCINRNHFTTMRIIKVRLGHADGSIVIETNFTGKYRVIFINLDAPRANNCTGRMNAANFGCVIIDRLINRLDLQAIDAIRDARLVSITAVPFLVGFGVNPLLTVTVHRQLTAESETLDAWVWIMAMTIVLGIVIGFLIGSGLRSEEVPCESFELSTRETRRSKDQAFDELAAYEYIEPTKIIESEQTYYEDVADWRNDPNYIEMIDTGYVAVV